MRLFRLAIKMCDLNYEFASWAVKKYTAGKRTLRDNTPLMMQLRHS